MASRGINKVILVGNIGQDPEIKYLPNGGAVANLTLATSDSYKDKNTGQEVEKTEWHRVCIFGKLAEICGEYVRKGSKLYIEGKLQTRKWQDQSGQDRYTTEIVLDPFNGVMQMLDSQRPGKAYHEICGYMWCTEWKLLFKNKNARKPRSSMTTVRACTSSWARCSANVRILRSASPP